MNESGLSLKDLSEKYLKPPKPKREEDESSDSSESFEPTPRLHGSKGMSESSLLMSEDMITIEETYNEVERT
jgi:hypothetical protein